MTNPTPSPAPQQWAIQAASEIVQVGYGHTVETAVDAAAAIITKHAAALSEENERLKREVERLNGERTCFYLDVEAAIGRGRLLGAPKSAVAAIEELRQWSEQAREAMAELLSYKIADHDLILDEAFLAKMRQVLQSHPAANKTEAGKK